MKTAKLIITFLTLFYAVSASAQFMNAPTAERTTTPQKPATVRQPRVKSDDTYSSRIYISYDMPTFVNTEDSDLSIDYAGFTTGYEYSIPIKPVPNLKVNVGTALSYSRYTEENYYTYDNSDDELLEKCTSDHVSISLPTSLSYSINLRDKLFFTPYFGFVFRYGLMFSDKYTYESLVYGADGSKTTSYLEDKENLYSGASMGGDEYTANRFNFAYQIGFNFDFNKFYVGLNYSGDLTETYDYVVYDNLSIRVGLKF